MQKGALIGGDDRVFRESSREAQVFNGRAVGSLVQLQGLQRTLERAGLHLLASHSDGIRGRHSHNEKNLGDV